MPPKKRKLREGIVERISSKNKDWTIAIDDGCVCYRYKLKASNKYSIKSLFDDIQKKVNKVKPPKRPENER